GTFGGWLSPDPLSPDRAQALARFLVARYPDLEWRLSPYAPAGDVAGAVVDHTYRLDLTEGFEAVRRRASIGHAHGARKARREGVRVVLAESAEDWADYFEVYRDTLARWGERTQVRYRRELFEAIAARRSPHVTLLLARHGSRTLAGTLCLCSPRIAVSWHSAARAAHFRLRPMDLLVHDAIRRAADEGRQWFDFNPSGWLEGVAAFKRGFGAEAVRADLYSARSARTRALATLSRAVKRVLRYDPGAPVTASRG
ncbi:MAG: GNAT family N-acetyltransferase, partial [Vicinamibacterales bacterium]|nr:GNAT family N-acetyltransferase [Vicinamibacterales bacterium]